VNVVVGADAVTVGRTVRDRLDRGEHTVAFVGDPDADREPLDQFVRDVVRDEES
jgi:hypothetical protein